MNSQCDKTETFSAASDRNKYPILEQLQRLLPRCCKVLEIGSGWGQHAVFFCREMPAWTWQPSEHPEAMAGLGQKLVSEGVPSVNPPLPLDVLSSKWPGGKYDAVYSANTAHIMPWPAVCAMFAGAGDNLAASGLFCLYGPFNVGGRFTSPGNEVFDAELRARNPEMGIRDMEALESLASGHQMILQERIAMPANNFLLVFRFC